MKLKGKHIFALILVLIGIAFTIYVTVPSSHLHPASCSVEIKDTTKTEKGAENGKVN